MTNNNFKLGDNVQTLKDIKTTRNGQSIIIPNGMTGIICDLSYDKFIIIETHDINGNFILLSVKPEYIKLK